MNVIVPDLNATETVDVAQLQVEAGLMVAEHVLAKADTEDAKKEAEAHKAEGEAILTEYLPVLGAPSIDIGYLPTKKKVELSNAEMVLFRDTEPEKMTEDELNKLEDLHREWVRWGVKNHANMGDMPFETEEVEYRGRKVQVVADHILELYGHMDLIHSLYLKIRIYNTLGAKKKSRSSPISGVMTSTSTAEDVPEILV